MYAWRISATIAGLCVCLLSLFILLICWISAFLFRNFTCFSTCNAIVCHNTEFPGKTTTMSEILRQWKWYPLNKYEHFDDSVSYHVYHMIFMVWRYFTKIVITDFQKKNIEWASWSCFHLYVKKMLGSKKKNNLRPLILQSLCKWIK